MKTKAKQRKEKARFLRSATGRLVSKASKSRTAHFDRLEMRQKAFVREYLKDFNATRSAIAAGYSRKTAYSIGWENLRKPEIAAALRELIEIAGITPERITQEVAQMALGGDLADFDDYNRGASLTELRANGSPTWLLKKVKTRREFEGRGDDKVEYVVSELELRDKLAALSLLARLRGIIGNEHSAAAVPPGEIGADYVDYRPRHEEGDDEDPAAEA